MSEDVISVADDVEGIGGSTDVENLLKLLTMVGGPMGLQTLEVKSNLYVSLR